MKVYIMVLFLLTGCAHKVAPKLTYRPELLIPYGIQTHDIDLHIVNGSTHSFKGIVSSSPDKITVIGLSPLSTTLFKIIDHLDQHDLQIEVFEKNLKKAQPHFENIYAILKDLLSLKIQPQKDTKFKNFRFNSKRFPVAMALNSMNENINITINKYDDNEIPQQIQIRHPKFFIEIKVIQYEIHF